MKPDKSGFTSDLVLNKFCYIAYNLIVAKCRKKTPPEWPSGGVFSHSGKGAERAKNPEMGFYLMKIFSRKNVMRKVWFLLFQEFDKLIAVGTDGGEISFDDEFWNRINL